MYSKLFLGVLAAQSLVTLNASVCMTGTLASYEALSPTAGCSEGPLTFKDFTFSSSVVIGSPVVATASDIILTPDMEAGGAILGFTYTLEVPSDFAVTAGQEVQYAISYMVDYPPIIVGGQEDMSDPSTLPGYSSVSETLTPIPQPSILPLYPQGCGGLAYHLPGPITITVASNGATSGSQYFSNKVCIYDNSTTITLDGGPLGEGGSADILSFKQDTLLPEPSYTFLTGLGSVLLVISRRLLRRQ